MCDNRENLRIYSNKMYIFFQRLKLEDLEKFHDKKKDQDIQKQYFSKIVPK